MTTMDDNRLSLLEQQLFAFQNELGLLRAAVERQRPLAGNCIAVDETGAGTVIHIAPGFMAGADEYFGEFAMVYAGKSAATGEDRFAVVDLTEGFDSERAGEVTVGNVATIVQVPRFEDDLVDGDVYLITSATAGVASSYIFFSRFDNEGESAGPLQYSDVVLLGRIREGRLIQLWRSGARTIDNRWW